MSKLSSPGFSLHGCSFSLWAVVFLAAIFLGYVVLHCKGKRTLRRSKVDDNALSGMYRKPSGLLVSSKGGSWATSVETRLSEAAVKAATERQALEARINRLENAFTMAATLQQVSHDMSRQPPPATLPAVSLPPAPATSDCDDSAA